MELVQKQFISGTGVHVIAIFGSSVQITHSHNIVGYLFILGSWTCDIWVFTRETQIGTLVYRCWIIGYLKGVYMP